MAVTGASEVRRRLQNISSEIENKRTVQALNAVGQIGMASAVRYAPIEYSTLVNSRKSKVTKDGGGWAFIGGFYVNYAAYLEFNPNWSPRPVDQKKGPAWNPRARPGFLNYGFTNQQSQKAMKKAAERIYYAS